VSSFYFQQLLFSRHSVCYVYCCDDCRDHVSNGCLQWKDIITGKVSLNNHILTNLKLPTVAHIRVLASSSNVPIDDSECLTPSNHGIIWCDPVLFSIKDYIYHVYSNTWFVWCLLVDCGLMKDLVGPENLQRKSTFLEFLVLCLWYIGAFSLYLCLLQ
jgi:hypothetical protein